jgi:hypothetical protein
MKDTDRDRLMAVVDEAKSVLARHHSRLAQEFIDLLADRVPMCQIAYELGKEDASRGIAPGQKPPEFDMNRVHSDRDWQERFYEELNIKDRLLRALQKVEWSGIGRSPACASCKRFQSDGHSADCPVGSALEEGK